MNEGSWAQRIAGQGRCSLKGRRGFQLFNRGRRPWAGQPMQFGIHPSAPRQTGFNQPQLLEGLFRWPPRRIDSSKKKKHGKKTVGSPWVVREKMSESRGGRAFTAKTGTVDRRGFSEITKGKPSTSLSAQHSKGSSKLSGFRDCGDGPVKLSVELFGNEPRLGT